MIIPQYRSYTFWGDSVILDELKFNVLGYITKNFIYKNDISGFPLITHKMDFDNEERYKIKIDEDGIIIEYASERALFYSINMIKKLINKRTYGYEIPKAVIDDYPSFKIRGVIEGFYGEPWTYEDRIEMVNFLGKYNMNTYVYAPKDDLYHRKEWKIPYPNDKLEELKSIIDTCKENYVDFVFSVSPGINITYSDDVDFGLLVDKYLSIMEFGVRKVALMLDDIDNKLKNENDIKMFENNLGKAQAYLANRLYKCLKEKYCDSTLILCPTEYAGFEDTEYKKAIKDSLNSDILLFWTGPKVASKKIDIVDSNEEYNLYGHDLVLWDNFPVNDGGKQLKIGPVRNRSNELYKNHIIGILSNPMNQVEISKIALMTYSDYTWNPESYIPEFSIKKALEIYDSENIDLLNTLYENCQSLDLWNEFAPKLSNYVKESIESNSLNNLKGYLKKIYKLYNDFDKFANERFKKELKPWLNKIKLTAKLGEKAIAIIEGEDIDINDINNVINEYTSDPYCFGENHVLKLAEYSKILKMSLSDKIKQIIMLKFREPDIEKIKKIKLTNIFFDGIYDPIKLKDIISDIKNSSDVSFLIAADHEGIDHYIIKGNLACISSAMAIGATNDKGHAYNYAYIQAKELLKLGFNMVYAPVLNTLNEQNYDLGTRSFGINIPNKIIEGLLKGYKNAGIYACAKYFPLFIGDNAQSSTVNVFVDLIKQLEPFKIAAGEKVPAILVTNNAINSTDGKLIPHSKFILNYIKNRLNYDGVLIVEINHEYSVLDYFVKSLIAGIDLIIIDDIEIIDEIIKFVEDKKDLDLIRRINEAATKILILKDMFKESDYDKGMENFFIELKDYILKDSITTLRQEKINLQKENDIFLIYTEQMKEFSENIKEELKRNNYNINLISINEATNIEIKHEKNCVILLSNGEDVPLKIKNDMKNALYSLQIIAGYPGNILDFSDNVIFLYDMDFGRLKYLIDVLKGQYIPKTLSDINMV